MSTSRPSGLIAAGLTSILVVAVVTAIGWVVIGFGCQTGDGSEQPSYPWPCYGSHWPEWALVIPLAGQIVGSAAWVRTIGRTAILAAATIGLAVAITVLLAIPQANPRFPARDQPADSHHPTRNMRIS